MENLYFDVIYRNGETRKIAEFKKTPDGIYVFEYVDNPIYEFPGFPNDQKRYQSNILWEQISFRISNITRKQYPNLLPEEVLKITHGKLVTDHFEFIPQERTS